MESKCGQCSQPYSKECESKQYCQYHKSECFRCKSCKQVDTSCLPNLIKCSLCSLMASADDLYYQFMCEKYFCCKHFLKQDFLSREMRLPCGCMVQTEHIVGFMNNFCILCGRKLMDKNNNQLMLCQVCAHKESFSDRSVSNYQFKMGSIQQNLNQQGKEAINLVNFQNVEPPERSESSHMEVVKILQKELQETNQKYQVADYSRKLIKKSFNHQSRDRECPICCLQFDLKDRKPMMICLKQHLICQHCFKKEVTLMCCPLCRQAIKKEHVIVCRERIINMQLEDLVSRKYEAAQKEYLAEKEKREKQKEKERIAILQKNLKSIEVQTDPIEELVPPAKKRKQTKKK